jgi:heme/copper-type cytochrome/quinol oxidase subunit 2
MKTAARVAALILLAAVLLPALLSACPLCKEDAEAAGSTGVWRGMYWSILLMLGAPFAVVGTMIGVILRARRKRPPAPPLAFPGPGGARP